MLRQQFLHLLVFAGLGFLVGAYATPTPDPSTTSSASADFPSTSTPTMSTSTAGSAEPTTTASLNRPSSSAISLASIPAAIANGMPQRFCPWCFNFEAAASESYCNLLVHVPEDLGKAPPYPALVFNHNFTSLVRTEAIVGSTQSYPWRFVYPDEKGKNVYVVFVPNYRQAVGRDSAFMADQDDLPPEYADIPRDQLKHGTGRYQDVILVPQPSDDPNGPLNVWFCD